MDMEQEQGIEAQHIKTEVLDVEDNLLSTKEDQDQIYTPEDINSGETCLVAGISKYECSVCDETFTDKICLKDHVNEFHHNNNCEKESNSPTGTEQQNEDIVYKCDHPNCGKSFSSLRALRGHSASHSEKGPFICEHANCLKVFRNKRTLTIHMSVHTNERPFKCSEEGCEKAFKTEKSMKTHFSTYHKDIAEPGVKLYKCEHPNCNEIFRNIHKFNSHLIVHSNKRPFKCDHAGCTKSFKRKRDLCGHKKLHEDETLFTCTHEGCSKSFNNKSNLKQHMRLHSDDRPYKCSHSGCQQAFKKKAYLNGHQRAHLLDSGAIETKVCDYYPRCSAKFRWERSYIKHMQQHKRLEEHHHGSNSREKESSCGKVCSASNVSGRETAVNEECLNANLESLQKNKVATKSQGCEEEIIQIDTYQCSICEEVFEEENEFEEHVECCGVYFKCELVDIDEINIQDM